MERTKLRKEFDKSKSPCRQCKVAINMEVREGRGEPLYLMLDKTLKDQGDTEENAFFCASLILRISQHVQKPMEGPSVIFDISHIISIHVNSCHIQSKHH